MPVSHINGREIHVDAEGFLTEYEEWDEDIARQLAEEIGIELSEAHLTVIRFLREDYREEGRTATVRRVSRVGGVPTRELFTLFPGRPARKMAYVAGLPKPNGCV